MPRIMKALITGAAGFIGSSLTDRLLAAGHQVVGIDSFEDYYARALKETNLAEATLSPDFRLVEASILDLASADDAPDSLPALVADSDVVFHLAAQAGVRGSWGRSFGVYTNSNVLATQLMLEAAKESGVERFVYASSWSVYGDTDIFPMREDANSRPFSPYGVTKLAAENLCRLYWRN